MKLLVGYRGTNVGQDLLDLAVKHAKAFNCEVQLVTSLPGGEKTSRTKITEAEDNLKEAAQFLEKENIKNTAHLLIRGRTAGEDIVSFAQETGCDEILIGVKSRSKVGKILFGSTAQYVILQASCPVTTVK